MTIDNNIKSIKKGRLLFVHCGTEKFIMKDLALLKQNYTVNSYFFHPTNKYFIFFYRLILQFLYLLINIFKYKYIFIWFADYHAILPVFGGKVFRKKTFVVIGGHDVESLPEFEYGLSKKQRIYQNKWIFRNATVCLSVADSLRIKILKIEPKAKVIQVPICCDFNTFTFSQYRREKIILTIAQVKAQDSHGKKIRFFIKGLDRFNELAKKMSDYKFIVVGLDNSTYNCYAKNPGNVEVLGFIKDQVKFINTIRTSSFYAQFSRSEGFPNALLEAMLCGCIPLGTDVGDIKKIVDGIGFVSHEWNATSYKKFILENHNNEKLRDIARNRIKNNYPLNRRKELLTGIISG